MTALLVAGVVCLTLLVVLRFGFVIVTIDGESMTPTLQSGDRILATRMWPRGWVRRGQIVVLRTTRLPVNRADRDTRLFDSIKQDMADRGETGLADYETITVVRPRWHDHAVKRLIGLPGDRVSIAIADLSDDQQATHRSRVNEDGDLVWDIPYDHCFIRGDGRRSGDSVGFGPVPIQAITSVMLFPLSRSEDSTSTAAADPEMT